MPVTECEAPSPIQLESRFTEAPYFQDSYRAPLQRPGASMADIFAAIFAHHPAWMKAALIARNRVARFCGLEAPSASEILHPAFGRSPAVGDTIGVWPIYALTDTELVAGRDNKHLDFRVSIFKDFREHAPSVVVSTFCTVHNWFGKVYLFFIVPFHRWGVRQLLSRAVAAGRL